MTDRLTIIRQDRQPDGGVRVTYQVSPSRIVAVTIPADQYDAGTVHQVGRQLQARQPISFRAEARRVT